MKRWIGRWLCVVAVLHSVVGVLLGRVALAGVARDGVWNALAGAPDRQLAFWFLAAGVSLFLIGALVDALERARVALPTGVGVGLLALTCVGIVLLPRSGFWLVLPAAIAAVQWRRAPRGGIVHGTVSFADDLPVKR